MSFCVIVSLTKNIWGLCCFCRTIFCESSNHVRTGKTVKCIYSTTLYFFHYKQQKKPDFIGLFCCASFSLHHFGAGNGSRTRLSGLGSRSSTDKLYLHYVIILCAFFLKMSSGKAKLPPNCFFHIWTRPLRLRSKRKAGYRLNRSRRK